MSYFITYFGIVIGDLVPEDEPAWELYLILYEIIDIITSPAISKDEVEYLKVLITNHNDLYRALFNEDLKAKAHLITHLHTCIEAFGPPRFYSTEKYERFHQK